MPPSQYAFAATDLRETSIHNLHRPPTPPADDSSSAQRMLNAAHGNMPTSRSSTDNTAAGMALDQEHSMYLTPATTPNIGTNPEEKQEETEDIDDDVTNEPQDDDIQKYYCHSRDASVQEPAIPALGADATTEDKHLTQTRQPQIAQDAQVDHMDLDVNPANHKTRDTVQSTDTNASQNIVLKGLSKVDMEMDRSPKPPAWDFSDIRPSMRCPSALFQPYSKFIGKQQSDRHSYNVEVTILTVDMDQCCVSGYLLINDLTPEHSRLQTFFTGQIVGGPRQRYSFRTTDPSWGANDKVDIQHWLRFPAWRPLAPYAKRDMRFAFPVNGDPWWTQDHVFMRWKEHFLVPDHKQSNIAGASFEGFYYICLSLWEGKISGVYFHSKSEKYQQLELIHETKHIGAQGQAVLGVSPIVEMR